MERAEKEKFMEETRLKNETSRDDDDADITSNCKQTYNYKNMNNNKDGGGHGETNPNPNKGKSCKGCLYYSYTLKSDSRNPLCVRFTRSLPQG